MPMTEHDPVRQIADAVLYEGHVLWPYRRSALKNQQRWTFGGIYPAVYARSASDRSRVGFGCLCEGEAPRLELTVRFLQVVHRQVLADGRPIDQLERGEIRYLTWDETTEREVTVAVSSSGETTHEIAIPAGRLDEDLGGGAGLVRSWAALGADVGIVVAAVGEGVRRISVTVANTSAFAGVERGEAMRRTLASAHVVVRVVDGELVSATDPPAHLEAAAAASSSDGLWPVLVGVEPDRSTLLASPIILSDYPSIAPESPGDFFDGGEVDQLLVLNILGLGDAERHEMRASDPRTREILERTEAMTSDDLMRLHGALREVRPAVGR